MNVKGVMHPPATDLWGPHNRQLNALFADNAQALCLNKSLGENHNVLLSNTGVSRYVLTTPGHDHHMRYIIMR